MDRSSKPAPRFELIAVASLVIAIVLAAICIVQIVRVLS